MTTPGYMTGFGNEFATEALPNALPKAQNSPQVCEYGLYAEQLSGTAFTLPRSKNERSWLYKIRPSVVHNKFQPLAHAGFCDPAALVVDPNQHRWDPPPLPSSPDVDFVDGITAMSAAGDPGMKSGLSVYIYTATKSMDNRVFHNSDGDFLIVPQQGTLTVRTEFGVLTVEPQEIVVVQRGIKFSVDIDGPARGYVSITNIFAVTMDKLLISYSIPYLTSNPSLIISSIIPTRVLSA
jgi:homogentisate 1,2-dioxygenase